MKMKNLYKISVLLFAFTLVGLACNLPFSSNDPGQIEPGEQQDAVVDPPQTSQESNEPIQVLPRPTRPEGQSNLPKPSMPAPPAQTTRQPAAIPEVQPTQSQNTVPQAPAEPGMGTFYIVNDTSSSVICYFYMAYSTEPEWGPDRLGEQDVVNPGETYTLTDVPSGTFDAQALDCDGNILAEVYGFDFPANDTFTLYDQ